MPRYIMTHRSKDLKRSVLVVSYHLMMEMKTHKEYKLNDMYQYLKNKLKIQQKDFVYTLNFLYILGKLEYIKAEDTIRLSK
uniref:ABC-three component system middle component 6 n=2 Tax=Hydrocurvibacter sulfurireducens TaxID=3131937 RepID=UPI003F61D8F3